MTQEAQPLRPGAAAAILIGEAQGGNSAQAVAFLDALVRLHGSELTETELRRLARLQAWGEPPLLVPVDTATLQATVRQVMENRGLWRRFRRYELSRLALRALGWAAGLLLLPGAVLAVVAGALIGIKWVLYWMGF